MSRFEKKPEMKIAISFALIFACSFLFGQIEKREIRKTVEVEVNEENGETKTIVRTEENGKVTEEVYEGKEAVIKAEKIREEFHADKKEDKTIEVEMKDVNGKKTLVVKETEGGKVKISKYQGKKAEKKLKEMQVH